MHDVDKVTYRYHDTSTGYVYIVNSWMLIHGRAVAVHVLTLARKHVDKNV